jgi:hypothetical protein
VAEHVSRMEGADRDAVDGEVIGGRAAIPVQQELRGGTA